MFAKSFVPNAVTAPSASPIVQVGMRQPVTFESPNIWSIACSLCPLEDSVYFLFPAHKVFVFEVVSLQVYHVWVMASIIHEDLFDVLQHYQFPAQS